MAFASLDDVNMHLPTDKLEMEGPELDLFGLDAERVIRGYLAGVIAPTTLAGWASPTQTPELIRAIAGRLIAAFYYRERYSEDSLDDPLYAQVKYNEAMELLRGVISGTVVLVEAPETSTVLGAHFSSEDFYPNATDDGPIFTMDDHLLTTKPGRK
jgi:hypothetical protein